MVYLPQNHFHHEVSVGRVPGHTAINKFGRVTTAQMGVYEFIATGGGDVPLLEAPSTVRVKAGGDVNDTLLGTGARTIQLNGINAAGDQQSEIIDLAGGAASVPSVNSFWRVFNARVASTGAYGVQNVDTIVVEDTGTTLDLIEIEAGSGSSQYGGFATPAGYRAIVNSTHITIDSGKTADVRVFLRPDFTVQVAPFPPTLLAAEWIGLTGTFPFLPKAPFVIGPLTDIWFEARGNTQTASATVDFEFMLEELT